MANQQDIQTFLNTNYLAVYRPIKKTYTLISWRQNRSFWKATAIIQTEIPNIDIRSHDTPVAEVNINISPFVNRPKYVRCKTQNKFIYYTDIRVPIIQKLPGSRYEFSQSMFAAEFTCTTINDAVPLWTQPLWALFPNPTEPATVANVDTNLGQQKPTPLPKRIAWLIAEDACKRNEICSITLEALTPITASVTNCFHVFEKNAIAEWFQTRSVCPMCKTNAVATVAFDM